MRRSSERATILVWPRNLDADHRQEVFAYARRQGFAIMRGGAANQPTTANLLIRLKGASKTYDGAYAPDSNREGAAAIAPSPTAEKASRTPVASM